MEDLGSLILENLDLTITIVSAVISLVLTIVIFAIKLTNTIKQKKTIENEQDLLDAVGPIMEIAEKLSNYTGQEKKEYVLTKVNQLAIENKVKYDETKISAKIEELISLTKNVNATQNKETHNEIQKSRSYTTPTCEKVVEIKEFPIKRI